MRYHFYVNEQQPENCKSYLISCIYSIEKKLLICRIANQAFNYFNLLFIKKVEFLFFCSFAFFTPYPTPAAINKTTPPSIGIAASGSSPGSPNWAYPQKGSRINILSKIVATNTVPVIYFINTKI